MRKLSFYAQKTAKQKLLLTVFTLFFIKLLPVSVGGASRYLMEDLNEIAFTRKAALLSDPRNGQVLGLQQVLCVLDPQIPQKGAWIFSVCPRKLPSKIGRADVQILRKGSDGEAGIGKAPAHTLPCLCDFSGDPFLSLGWDPCLQLGKKLVKNRHAIKILRIIYPKALDQPLKQQGDFPSLNPRRIGAAPRDLPVQLKMYHRHPRIL